MKISRSTALPSEYARIFSYSKSRIIGQTPVFGSYSGLRHFYSSGQCSGSLAASELVLAEGDQLGDVAGLAGAGDRPAAQEVVLTADGPAHRGQQVTAAAHDTPTCRSQRRAILDPSRIVRWLLNQKSAKSI